LSPKYVDYHPPLETGSVAEATPLKSAEMLINTWADGNYTRIFHTGMAAIATNTATSHQAE